MSPELPPSPSTYDWYMKDGKCLPPRYKKPVLPQCLSAFKDSVARTEVDEG